MILVQKPNITGILKIIVCRILMLVWSVGARFGGVKQRIFGGNPPYHARPCHTMPSHHAIPYPTLPYYEDTLAVSVWYL